MSVIDTYFGIRDSGLEPLLHPPPSVLEGLDASIRSMREEMATNPTKYSNLESRFGFAALLISHNNRENIVEGIGLMEQILFTQWPKGSQSEVLDVSSRRLLVSYLLYISVGRSKLGEYDMAHSAARKLLEVEPNDRQGAELLRYIEGMQTREGVVGLAGVAAFAGVGLAAALAIGSKILSKR